MSMVDSSRKRPREFISNGSSSANTSATTTATSTGWSDTRHKFKYDFNDDDEIINLISDDEDFADEESDKFSITSSSNMNHGGMILADDFYNSSAIDDGEYMDTVEDRADFHARGRKASVGNHHIQSFMSGVPRVKKLRTNSLPQLPHTRISYLPPSNLQEALTRKIGDVKTNFIPYNAAARTSSNYTLANPKFDKPKKKAASKDICDDNEGHYLIKPGDYFANNRFQFQKILGQGTFGKVVSALDIKSQSVCAIKIIRSIPKYREASKIELRVLSTIKKHDPLNQNHCIHLRECFDYRGHICIVTDLLKISLFDFLENNKFYPFPGSHIQAIAKQLLRSVAFLHDLNLIHTDLKPENVLLQNDSYVRKPYGKSHRKILVDPCIYTIDFGSAIFNDEYHSLVVSTRHYRAPEIILGIGWSFPCDLWSVGCILVELATGDALFKTHSNLEHLALMEKILQSRIDTHLINQAFRKRRNSNSSQENVCDYFKNGKLVFPGMESTSKSIEEVRKAVTLDELIGSKCGFRINTNISLEENYKTYGIKRLEKDTFKFWFYFIDLLKRLLCYDPEKRLKAVDALNHRWFDLGIYDDGTL